MSVLVGVVAGLVGFVVGVLAEFFCAQGMTGLLWRKGGE